MIANNSVLLRLVFMKFKLDLRFNCRHVAKP